MEDIFRHEKGFNKTFSLFFFLDRPVLLYLKKKINRPKTRGNYKQGDYKVSQTRPPLGLGMTHIGQTLQKKI